MIFVHFFPVGVGIPILNCQSLVAVLLPRYAPNRHEVHLCNWCKPWHLEISLLASCSMEVLFEYRGSRRQLSVSDKKGITRVVSSELQRIGKPRAQVFTANDDLPSGRRAGGERVKPEVYLLQRWSAQWECYVDVGHCNEVCDGDKLAVIAKPKPPSKASWNPC